VVGNSGNARQREGENTRKALKGIQPTYIEEQNGNLEGWQTSNMPRFSPISNDNDKIHTGFPMA